MFFIYKRLEWGCSNLIRKGKTLCKTFSRKKETYFNKDTMRFARLEGKSTPKAYSEKVKKKNASGKLQAHKLHHNSSSECTFFKLVLL